MSFIPRLLAASGRRESSTDVSPTRRETEALESKLDDMAAQLAVLTQQQQQQTTAVSSEPAGALSSSQIDPTIALASGSAFAAPLSPSFAIGNSRSSGFFIPVSAPSQDDPVLRGLIPEQQARERLETFRASFTPHCPFVALHPAHTLGTVRNDLPSTFLAIMAVTEARSATGKVLQESLCQLIMRRVYLAGESSLDLLRAVLILVAWQQHFEDVQTPKPFLLLQLCVTMAHDLGLEKSASSLSDVAAPPTGDRDSVEKRLLLGVFWLSVK